MTATIQRKQRTSAPPRTRLPVSNFAAKTTMAVTGLIFVGFVFVHMYGNLHIFRGQEEFDHYAHWRARFNLRDDGHAAERVVARILDQGFVDRDGSTR